MADTGAFYDYGWNARMEGKPYIPHNSRDWRDGWKDCDEALASGEVQLGEVA